MESTSRHYPGPRLFHTVCAGLIVCGAITAAVMTGGPRRSSASPERDVIRPPASIDWKVDLPADVPRVICELIGTQFRVRVLAADPEPLYTVMSLDGAVLMERGTVSEVTAGFPTLDLAGMKDAEGHEYAPLMLMDSAKD
ncbi:MAG: hypothetical protein AB7G11_00355 [Phycisphaerales bacterium]